MAVLSAAYYYPHAENGAVARRIDDFLRLQAHGAAALIALFDPTARAHGTEIAGRFPLRIVKSCSSLDAQALFAAVVTAFPAPVWQKLAGLAAGIAALTLLNMGRIAGLSWIGAHAPESFDAFHEEILPLALVGFACLAFAAWARWARRVPAPP
jgi:exosortase/archaeosortase family protein